METPTIPMSKVICNGVAVYYSKKTDRFMLRDPIKKRYIPLTYEQLVAVRIALSMVGGPIPNVVFREAEGFVIIQVGDNNIKKELDLSAYHRLEDFGIETDGGDDE